MASKGFLFGLLRRASAVGVVAVGAVSYVAVERHHDDGTPSERLNRYLSQWRMKAHAADATQSELPVWDDNWDNRKGDIPSEEPKRVSRRHLILIRHGQYNMEGKTDAERVLTELGREQAGYTAKRLREFGFKFDVLHCSTMSRAMETAGIIAQELEYDESKMEKFDSIREGFPIEPVPGSTRLRRSASEPAKGSKNDNLVTDEKFNSTFRNELRRFERDAESERIEGAFRTIFYRPLPNAADTYEVYVCHANVIRYFLCRALQIDPHAWLRFSLAHASITHLILMSNGRVVAQAIGDAGHIPAAKRSF